MAPMLPLLTVQQQLNLNINKHSWSCSPPPLTSSVCLFVCLFVFVVFTTMKNKWKYHHIWHVTWRNSDLRVSTACAHPDHHVRWTRQDLLISNWRAGLFVMPPPATTTPPPIPCQTGSVGSDRVIFSGDRNVRPGACWDTHPHIPYTQEHFPSVVNSSIHFSHTARHNCGADVSQTHTDSRLSGKNWFLLCENIHM